MSTQYSRKMPLCLGQLNNVKYNEIHISSLELHMKKNNIHN